MASSRSIKAGGGERGQYFMKNSNDCTIRFALHYPCALDPKTLCAAVRSVVECVDVLHGSFVTNGIGAWWQLNDTADAGNYFHFLETEEDPAQIVQSLLLSPIEPGSKAQLHCTLVQNEERSSIGLRISHLVADGSDGKYLLKKVAEAYNLIASSGNAAALKLKNGRRDPELVYEMIGREDMKRLKKASVSASNVRSFYPYPDDAPGCRRMILAAIPPEVMAAARKKAKQANASVNDLMIAATYHAYSKMDGIDKTAPMCMNATIDLRRHCKNGDSEGLSNMSGSFMTVLDRGCTGSFAETLTAVSKQTNAIKHTPYAGLEGMPIVHALARKAPPGLMLAIMQRVYRTAPVGITNLGDLKCSDFALEGVSPIGGFLGGPLKKKPGMQICVISFDNMCTLSVVTSCTDADALLLQKTLDDIVYEITVYAK